MTTHTFALTGSQVDGVQLDVRAGFGTLTVVAEDGRTDAVVTLTGPSDSDIAERTAVDLRGSTVVIVSPRPRAGVPFFGARAGRDRDAVTIEAIVPSGTAVRLGAISCNVTTRGRTGDLDLAYGNGTATLDDVDGHLRVRHGAGATTVRRVRGSAVFKSGAGDVTIGRTDGSLMLMTGSGGLSVGVPSGITARLDVITGNGQLQSEMPVHTAPSGTGRKIEIHARTGRGDVNVRRAPGDDAA